MATLTEVSYYARQLIKWGGLALAVILVTPPIVRWIYRAYIAISPPPPPAPTVRYGKLPKLTFPQPASSKPASYRLETIDGQLPILSTTGKVYLLEINRSRLGELEKIKTQALALGFGTDPEKLDEQTYKFTHPRLPANLTANIISGAITYTYDWGSDPDFREANNLPSREQAIADLKDHLQNLKVLSPDLANGETKVTYLRHEGNTFIPVQTPSEANFVQVDLFRQIKDDLKFVTPTVNSAIQAVFSSVSDSARRLISLNFGYSKILDDDFATYPLKTVSQAWEELKQGGGYIASTPRTAPVIRQVQLAYYESGLPQAFIQPVFVFSGDGGFIAYVPAISPEYQE